MQAKLHQEEDAVLLKQTDREADRQGHKVGERPPKPHPGRVFQAPRKANPRGIYGFTGGWPGSIEGRLRVYFKNSCTHKRLRQHFLHLRAHYVHDYLSLESSLVL